VYPALSIYNTEFVALVVSTMNLVILVVQVVSVWALSIAV